MNKPLSVCIVLFCMLTTPILAKNKNKVPKMDRNTSINMSYGIVLEVESVKLQSDAAKNATLAGMVGLATSHGKSDKDKAGSAIAGALLAGLITKAVEGKHKANAFTVRRTDGSTVKIIMDHADVRVGDCVSIEEGRTSNLRHVSEVLCQDTSLQSDVHIEESHSIDADECHMAKELLLKAETEEDFDRATLKIKILCH